MEARSIYARETLMAVFFNENKQARFCQKRKAPSKHINAVSRLSFSWHNVTKWKMSNQRWNNVAYFNFGIYNVEQRWINVVYFNVDMNNVRQRRNNVVIFNVEFHNVDQRRNNVVKMTISKKNRKIIWNWINWILSFNNYFIFLLILLPMLGGICWRKLAKPPKFLKVHEKNCITRT